LFLCGAVAASLASQRAAAQEVLDAAGLTFRDFAVNDNGASFGRGADSIIAGGPNQVSSRVAAIDAANGLARVQFASIRVDISLPLGWQATEDWERGVAYSTDKRFRLIIWRVDFAFEGAKDAEHYAAMKSGSIQARRPNVQAHARKLGEGYFLIVYENVARSQGDSETRTVFDLLMQKPGNPKEGVLLTLGVPASQAERGLRLLALLKQSINITW
jgi:hypothetical protein